MTVKFRLVVRLALRTLFTWNPANPAVASGSYSVSSRSGKSINTVLLALLGIEPTRRIATNETYHTVAFTWNAVRHLMLVPEDQVGRPQPSILFPKSTTLTTLTQSLSSLLVLVQETKSTALCRQKAPANVVPAEKPWNSSSTSNWTT